MARNAAIVLGNLASPDATDVLTDALQLSESNVRRHAAWALGRLTGDAPRRALRLRMESETDPEVRAEISRALDGVRTSDGQETAE